LLARFCGIIIKQLITYKNKFMKNRNLEDARLYAGDREWDPIVNGNDDDELELEDDITSEDIALLDATDHDSTDNDDLESAYLDDMDEDGDELNEKSSANDNSGRDLDIPGSNDDDEDEDIGDEDEENNSYSEADTE
jgi:hypothetical protein